MSRFHGPRSIQCPGRCSAELPVPSSPGRASSVVSVCTLVIDPTLFRRLPRREPRKRAGRDIFRDDRTRCNPCVVADLDGSIERIVDSGPDVAADARDGLRLPRLVLEVGSDVAGGDVRILSDLGVADIGEVRNLGARPDGGLLDLDERPDLRVATDLGTGSHGCERPKLDARRDCHAAADDGERMDRDVVLDLYVAVDPRRLRVDNRHAREHVRLVMRSRNSAAATASSARVLTPSTYRGSSATCTATGSPSFTRKPTAS